jgi:hypothetical protein
MAFGRCNLQLLEKTERAERCMKSAGLEKSASGKK